MPPFFCVFFERALAGTSLKYRWRSSCSANSPEPSFPDSRTFGQKSGGVVEEDIGPVPFQDTRRLGAALL